MRGTDQITRKQRMGSKCVIMWKNLTTRQDRGVNKKTEKIIFYVRGGV